MSTHGPDGRPSCPALGPASNTQSRTRCQIAAKFKGRSETCETMAVATTTRNQPFVIQGRARARLGVESAFSAWPRGPAKRTDERGEGRRSAAAVAVRGGVETRTGRAAPADCGRQAQHTLAAATTLRGGGGATADPGVEGGKDAAGLAGESGVARCGWDKRILYCSPGG